MPKLGRLRDLRVAQALSQRALASQAGVSPATIVRAERGDDIRHVTVRKLADALGVPPSELLSVASTRSAQHR